MTTPQQPDLSYLKVTTEIILNGGDTTLDELEYALRIALPHLTEEARGGSEEALTRLRLITVLTDQDVPLSDLLYALGDALQSAVSTIPVSNTASNTPPPRATQQQAPVAPVQPAPPTRATQQPDPQTTQVIPGPSTLLQPDPATATVQTPDPAASQQGTGRGNRPPRAPKR